jgi:hypothetical protein
LSSPSKDPRDDQLEIIAVHLNWADRYVGATIGERELIEKALYHIFKRKLKSILPILYTLRPSMLVDEEFKAVN